MDKVEKKKEEKGKGFLKKFRKSYGFYFLKY